jgi:two-component system nitrogen regulation response regulator NtrX
MHKIVVIDDDSDITGLINHYLKDSHRFEVISFNDEFQALKSLNKENPDVILLDLYLSGTDGIKIKTFIDALSPYKVPVIFMSSYSSASIIMEAELTVDDQLFLQKPISKDALMSAIEKCLKVNLGKKKSA